MSAVNRLIAHINPALGFDDVQFYLTRQHVGIGERKTEVGYTAFKAHEFGAAIDPVFSLSVESARQLMDSLWGAGIRPTHEGTVGQLGAMQKHIGDLRTIAYHALKIRAEDESK